MKNIVKLLTFGVVLIIAGCDRESKTNIYRRSIEIRYKETKGFFPRKLVDHFPKQLKGSFAGHSANFSWDGGCLDISLYKFSINQREFQTIKSLKDRAIAVYNAGDSCLLVLNDNVEAKRNMLVRNENVEAKTNVSFYREKVLDNVDCDEFRYPVLYFRGSPFPDPDNRSNLPSDFNIYVLDAKFGEFLPKCLLKKKKFEPFREAGGYSRGIAFSEESHAVIYWVVVW